MRISFSLLVILAAVIGILAFSVIMISYEVDDMPSRESTPSTAIVIENTATEAIECKFVGAGSDEDFERIADAVAVPWIKLLPHAEWHLSVPADASQITIVFRPLGMDSLYGVKRLTPSKAMQKIDLRDSELQALRGQAKAEKSASGSAQAAPPRERTLAETMEYVGTQEFVDRLSRNSPLMRITEEALGPAEAATAVANPPKQE